MGSNKSIVSGTAFEKGTTVLITLLLIVCLQNLDAGTYSSHSAPAPGNDLQKHALVTTGLFGASDYLKTQVIKPSENETRQSDAPARDASGKASFPGYLSIDSGFDLPDSHNDRKYTQAAFFLKPVKRTLQAKVVTHQRPALENTILASLLTVIMLH